MWLVRTTAGRFTELLLNLANVTEICSTLEQSWKKVYSRAPTKSIPLLQPEHSKEWIRTWPNTGLVSEWKNRGGTFVWMVDAVLQGAWVLYCIVLRRQGWWVSTSSSFSKWCCQCNVSRIIKGIQIIPEPYRNSKYPSYVCYDDKTLLDAFWTQTYSKIDQSSKMECFCANS